VVAADGAGGRGRGRGGHSLPVYYFFDGVKDAGPWLRWGVFAPAHFGTTKRSKGSRVPAERDAGPCGFLFGPGRRASRATRGGPSFFDLRRFFDQWSKLAWSFQSGSLFLRRSRVTFFARGACPADCRPRARFELGGERLRIAIPLPESLSLVSPSGSSEKNPQWFDYAAPQGSARVRRAGGRASSAQGDRHGRGGSFRLFSSPGISGSPD
jgi:hypothetical protein